MTRREWDEIWAATPTAEATLPTVAGLVLIPAQRNRISALDDVAS